MNGVYVHGCPSLKRSPCAGSQQRDIIEQLAAYIVEPPFVDKELEIAAIRCVYDLLSAVAVGTNDPGAVSTRKAASTSTPPGSIKIWFTGQTSSAVGAAWAISAAAVALDLDDGNRSAMGHPGAAVIPTAYSIALDVDATFDKFIKAIVVGYEVAVTIGAARKTFGETMTWSVYGVVAAASVLRRVDKTIVEHALGIASWYIPSHTPSNSPEFAGSHVKEGIPWSVFCGLQSLALAEAGHTGPRNHLDDTVLYDYPLPLQLGTYRHICDTYFKPYSCCRYVHGPIDAFLGLVDEFNIDHSSITEVKVHTFARGVNLTNRTKPENLVDIQYSIPYCLAIAVVLGPSHLLPLATTSLGREDLTEFAKCVTLVLDSELDDRFPAETLCWVSVACAAGTFTSDITTPRGEASKPLSWKELEQKFRTVSQPIASKRDVEKIVRGMEALKVGEFKTLWECLETLNLVDDSIHG